MIYQELSPIKKLSIAENVFVGRYPKTKSGVIDWKTMYDSCQKIFDRWGLNYNPRTKMKMLKTADVQMIEMLYDFIRALKRRDAAPCAASLSVNKVRFPAQFHCSSYTRPFF